MRTENEECPWLVMEGSGLCQTMICNRCGARKIVQAKDHIQMAYVAAIFLDYHKTFCERKEPKQN